MGNITKQFPYKITFLSFSHVIAYFLSLKKKLCINRFYWFRHWSSFYPTPCKSHSSSCKPPFSFDLGALSLVTYLQNFASLPFHVLSISYHYSYKEMETAAGKRVGTQIYTKHSVQLVFRQRICLQPVGEWGRLNWFDVVKKWVTFLYFN